MKNSRAKNMRGESLIEAMAAMVVFAVGMLGILHMNVLASGQNGMARRQSSAVAIARDLVDAFERMPYSDPMFAPSGLTVDANFAKLTTTTGLHLMPQSPLPNPWPTNGRPLMGATRQILTNDSEPNAYIVGWRVSEDSEGARHIVVMVSFLIPGGGRKQVEVWTVKHHDQRVVGSTGNKRIEI